MKPKTSLESQLSPEQLGTWKSLTSPVAIQLYLDTLPYMHEDLDRSPLQVITDGQCHCLDGGLLAAAALRRIGFPPLIMDLVPAVGLDDDHVLAIFRVNGKYGAIAKSNFASLRYREPVFRNLRELAMSYFEGFFNVDAQKTLRAYTLPMDLSSWDTVNWETSQEGTAKVVEKFYSKRPIPLISEDEAAALNLVDERTYKAFTTGTNFNELFQSE